MLKQVLLVSFLFLLVFAVCAQTPVNTDSLWKVWSNTKNADTTRLKAIKAYNWNKYIFTKPDSAWIIANMGLKFAERKNNKYWQAEMHNLQGISFFFRTQYNLALKSYLQSLKLNAEIDNKAGMSRNYSNMGGIYQQQGDYPKALDCAFKCMELNIKIGDKKLLIGNYSNIGIIYDLQGNYNKGLEYYGKAVKVANEIHKPEEANSARSNMVVALEQLKRYEEAIDIALKLLPYYEKTGNKNSANTLYSNLGICYSAIGKFELAEKYLKIALEGAKEMQAGETIGRVYMNMGNLKLAQKQYALAVENGLKAMDYFETAGSLPAKLTASRCLYEAYKAMGKTSKALEYHEKFVALKDSILSDERNHQIIQKEFKFAYEKKAMADSVRNLEKRKAELAVKNAQLAQKNAQIRQEETERYALYGGLLLVILFSFFMVNRFRIIKRQKKVIEEQKIIVEEKQKEIVDSIKYASRIQKALFPSDTYINSNLQKPGDRK
jgi:adenylate cyclase